MTTTVIATGLSLAGLWVLAFWLYRDYRVDVFRQNMFDVRDELFDFARDGGIAFDHPAYRGLRSVCNGYIRFGHQVAIPSAVLASLMLDSDERAWMEKQGFDAWWVEATNDLDAQTVRALDAFKAKMNRAVGGQLVFGSPVTIVLAVTVIPGLVALAAMLIGFDVVTTIWRRLIGGMDETAHALGQAA